MRNGPPLVIDATVFYQLISDPAFFVRVPVFLFLKPQAQAVVAKIVAKVMGRETSVCCSNIREDLQPLLLAFTKIAAELADTNRPALDPLIAYIAGRRNYRPHPILITYRDGASVRQLEL